MKFTVALPNFGVLVGVIPSAATHKITAVHMWRGAVTQPPLSPYATGGAVFFAVVWRSLNVDQVCLHGLLVVFDLFDLKEGGLAEPVRPNHFHVHCIVVLLF